MWHWMQDGAPGPWMGIGLVLFWLVLIALAGLLVWGGVRLLSQLSQKTPPSAWRDEESSLELLKRRYAKGEIDRRTFQEMRHELES